jgi:hypothetical protein
MVANIVNQTANFDLMSGFIDDATGIFDGQDNTDGRATLQISTSQDAITYSPWQDFVVGDYRAEAFKFRVLLESFSNSVNVLVSQLKVSVDMPDRLESGKVTSAVGGPLVVNYPAAFRTLPNLGITLEAAATGDYFELSNQTLDSFSVVVRNAAGTNIARSLHWYAKGFGKKIVI